MKYTIEEHPLLKWGNLKCDCCPKCGSDIKSNGAILDTIYICSKCDFSISEEKYELIVGNRFKQTKKEKGYVDHLSELNNLGRPKVKEDFSEDLRILQ